MNIWLRAVIRVIAGLLAMIALQAPAAISRGDRYSGVPWATRSPVLAQHAMAANAAIGLMQPVLNGIGGDLFAIMYDPVHYVHWGGSEMRKDGEAIGY